MDKQSIQQLREIPIEDIASRLGLEIRQHKSLCPFHADHHPSLSFNPRRNTYRCFVCDAHGGTIDLVMHLLHKDFKEACQWLFNGTYEPPKTIISNLLSINSNPPFDPSKYQRFFAHPYLSPAAKSFLFSQRHLDPRVIRWCCLTSWRDRQGTDWLQIPYYAPQGKLIGIQNRNLGSQNGYPEGEPSTAEIEKNKARNLNYQPHVEGNPSSSPELGDEHKVQWTFAAQRADGGVCPPRFRFPKGAQCHIYNLPVLNMLRPGEELYIAEGCSDCWSLLSSGHKAIAIPSATLLNPKDLDTLLSINSKLSTQFHMFPDRDLPGERLFLQLRDLLPNLHRHDLPPTCKDFSDYYVYFKV